VITHILKTHGRTPLDEWSARRRDLYLHRTTQHINTRDNHPCPERDSNPRPQQPSGRRFRPRGHWDRHSTKLVAIKRVHMHSLKSKCGNLAKGRFSSYHRGQVVNRRLLTAQAVSVRSNKNCLHHISNGPLTGSAAYLNFSSSLSLWTYPSDFQSPDPHSISTWLIDWLIDYDGVRLSQNNGHQRPYCSSPTWYVSVEIHGDVSGWG
jgi:hypothetical protein